MMKKRIILIVTVVMFLFSCSEEWFTIAPKGQANIETLYNKKGVDVLLTGAYALLDGVTRGEATNRAGHPVFQTGFGEV